MDGGHARQQHGIDFEQWFLETFLESYYVEGHTGKWDATRVKYRDEFKKFTSVFEGLPISIKTCKKGSPIGFGDALRQYTVAEDFLLVVGFWEGKRFISVQVVVVSQESWHELFLGTVSKEELQNDKLSSDDFGEKLKDFDSMIKNRDDDYKIVRKKAKAEKGSFPQMDIVLNPKIDSKGQRRLQCSLPNKIYLNTLGKRSARAIIDKDGDLALWGEKIPNKN